MAHADIPHYRYLLLILILIIPLSVLADEPELHFASETILSVFERENEDGDSRQILPIYEYMQLDYGQLETEGLSLHLHGWLRGDAGDGGYYEEDSDGELLYGYVEYLPPSGGFNLKIGRQHLFSGIVNDSVDGVVIRGMFGSYMTLELFGGVPMALDDENGRSGDTIFGGRSAVFLNRLSEIGLSYKKIIDDGETVENTVGLDTSLGVSTRLTLHGLSSWNVETQEWREHSYEAALSLDPFLLKPLYQAYGFQDYFSEDTTELQPFRFLQETDEKLVIIGADAILLRNPGFDTGIRIKQYEYDQRDETSQYAAVIVNFYTDNASQYGLEGGIMQGESSENRYQLGRGYLLWNGPFASSESWFLSTDLLFIQYEEEIYGKDKAWFISLGGGKQLVQDTLQLSVSADHSSDPYFDEDTRFSVVLKYVY